MYLATQKDLSLKWGDGRYCHHTSGLGGYVSAHPQVKHPPYASVNPDGRKNVQNSPKANMQQGNMLP